MQIQKVAYWRAFDADGHDKTQSIIVVIGKLGAPGYGSNYKL